MLQNEKRVSFRIITSSDVQGTGAVSIPVPERFRCGALLVRSGPVPVRCRHKVQYMIRIFLCKSSLKRTQHILNVRNKNRDIFNFLFMISSIGMASDHKSANKIRIGEISYIGIFIDEEK